MIHHIGRRHIDSGYERELYQLLDQVLFMGARVEDSFSDSLRAFVEHDVDLAEKVIAADAAVDRLERDIDAACVDILSRRQPMASDLRFITTTFKVVRDLERIGALSAGICLRVVESRWVPHVDFKAGVETMGALAREMLNLALDAYVAGDAHLAGEVVKRDRLLDEEYRLIWSTVTGRLTKDSVHASQLMRVVSIAKSVERIADHAASVAEMVVFMVEAGARPSCSVPTRPSA